MLVKFRCLVTQQNLLRIFLVPGLIVFSCVYLFAATLSLRLLECGIFLAGLPLNGPFSLLGQLFAADVIDTLARHRRDFRDQHRSPRHRCIERAARNSTHQPPAGNKRNGGPLAGKRRASSKKSGKVCWVLAFPQ
jgi:hypothetical protein